MKTSSLWIIRVALTVQLIGVLAVPAAVAAAESPRAMWMAEWLRSRAVERTIGVLKLRDGTLSFTEMSGQAEWSIDIASVKRVSSGRTMTIESNSGETYVMSIMDSNLTQESPEKVVAMIDRLALSEGRRER
jgi:hypothetical protein